ncbi:MAG: protein-L-isoaspartate(D-aspartate) O-methyltransferase [Bacteroidales bacterium]|jgi:protein-L-isoaspartate(D-aspartate) O-methyltransferase|nr:protein-L-isoaspartate(D-aspartate) O-methyltransferase [Bacteroidales bacterium]MDY0253364.1 protein-L-isoaspartate(D-aspartate) O-methyltransferase [Tenuifilaceae bacterium]
MEDSFRHKGLRKKLVEEIRSKGITCEKVLAAINKVPRHLFMESGFLSFSYKDSAFPIGAGQTISQPYTVAFQTELLDIKPQEKVLEIGTGSGYQTAVLLEMGAKVYTIERQHELYVKAKTLLEKLNYTPHFFYGDGYQGKPTYGPYHKILVTAGAPEIPTKLIEQLVVGGKMVIPVGDGTGQNMMLVEKVSETDTRISNHGRFVFVPLLKGTNK